MAKKNDKEAQENWSHKNDFPIIEVWNTYQAIAVPLRNTTSMAFALTSRV